MTSSSATSCLTIRYTSIYIIKDLLTQRELRRTLAFSVVIFVSILQIHWVCTDN